MQRSDFHFDLPDELIARYPAAERTASRLLELNGVTGEVVHRRFTDLLNQLQAGDLLVFNDTKVLPARLWGQKASGGRIEVLVERVVDEHSVLAHIRSSKSPKPGSEVWLRREQDGSDVAAVAEVTGRQGALFELRFTQGGSALEVMKTIGHMPLPPYIDRADEQNDQERYQTVYGRREGAVAAPTAGLHFSEAFIEQARAKGVKTAFVTLHVGAGTFQPVRADDIRDHQMHSEWIEVSEEVCEQVAETHAAGGRVIAVGTTAVRSLESAAATGELKPLAGDSDIFIYPGYQFRCIDGLVTNFHLPESTLIMLVSAFAGQQHVMDAYREAVTEQYRFFSYGDAMLVWPQRASLLREQASQRES